ncbi:MAG: hypothetical protein EOP93_00480 [Lysobacteraceae bacterium]|nr:MAG: hypothetical protein EOP93_00480 [Xanthomonadaceae bacterium]
MMLVVVLSLGACGKAPAPAATTPQAGAAVQPAAPAELKDPTGMLTLSPGTVDMCSAVDGVISMDVSWDASKANTDGIKIYLKDPSTGEEKLWLAAPAQGHDKTGPWMREGTVVRLVNDQDDADLAKLTVTSTSCTR